MKTTLLLTLLMIAGTVSAQNFSYPNTGMHANSVIPNNTYTDVDVEMYHSESVDFEFNFSLVENTLPACWDYSVCVLGYCYTTMPSSGAMTPTPDSLPGFVKITMNPGDVPGNGKMILYIYDRNNPSFGDTISLTISNDLAMAGDANTNLTIDNGELCGDLDQNGAIDGGEIAGDVSGDGVIADCEVAGDLDGDGLIGPNEIAGDADGSGIVDGGEIAGDLDGNGLINGEELAGDTDGSGTFTASELAGDLNGDGAITGAEVQGDANGNGALDGSETVGIANAQIDLPSLSPNPTNGFIQVKNVSTTAVLDYTGRLLLTSNERSIDLSTLAQGMYIVQLTDLAGKVHTQQIVKK